MSVTSVILRDDRHEKLLELLPKHKWRVAPAAVEAGFTRDTAYKQGKSLVLTALKRRAQQVIKDVDSRTMTTQEAKKTIAEKLGLTSDEVTDEYKKIVQQDRDLATKFKALIPILRDEGIQIDDESSKVTVPVLNLTMEAPTTAVHSHITRTIEQASDNTDCTTQEDGAQTGGTEAPEGGE